jgi:hypothetical protein
MGSSGKTRTTFAKLNRESKLREKRAEKEARKAAKKFDAADDAADMDSRAGELGTPSADPDIRTPDRPEAGSTTISDAQSDGA